MSFKDLATKVAALLKSKPAETLEKEREGKTPATVSEKTKAKLQKS